MALSVTVSVFMLTYNQERFIAHAIKGVLAQQTNFKYQLVIGEDGSTDKTLGICKHYQQQHPDRIKLIAQPENLGLMPNFVATAAHLSGKYIAICDGDDYWIDPNKLQKQVDFLEEQDEYSIVYAKTKKCYPDGSEQVSVVKPGQLETKNFTHLVQENCISSVTVLFRNPLLKMELPEWFKQLPYGDWPLYLYVLADGSKVHFMDEVVAVYRVQIGESFKLQKHYSKAVSVKLNILNHLLIDSHFSLLKQEIKSAIIDNKFSLMVSYNREKEYLKALKTFFGLFAFYRPLGKLFKMYGYSVYKSLK